jgi:hypothetical protein
MGKTTTNDKVPILFTDSSQVQSSDFGMVIEFYASHNLVQPRIGMSRKFAAKLLKELQGVVDAE